MALNLVDILEKAMAPELLHLEQAGIDELKALAEKIQDPTLKKVVDEFIVGIDAALEDLLKQVVPVAP